MKASVLRSLTLLSCLAATALVTGCGKSSPTAPGVTPTPAPTTVVHTDVRFDYVAVVRDGDLIGDGDFEFRFGVNGATTFSAKTLGTNDVWHIDTRRTVDGMGRPINVHFQASELDRDILGNIVPDPDMNGRNSTDEYTVAEGLGGQHAITLGNDFCKVKLYYSLITYRTDN